MGSERSLCVSLFKLPTRELLQLNRKRLSLMVKKLSKDEVHQLCCELRTPNSNGNGVSKNGLDEPPASCAHQGSHESGRYGRETSACSCDWFSLKNSGVKVELGSEKGFGVKTVLVDNGNRDNPYCPQPTASRSNQHSGKTFHASKSIQGSGIFINQEQGLAENLGRDGDNFGSSCPTLDVCIKSDILDEVNDGIYDFKCQEFTLKPEQKGLEAFSCQVKECVKCDSSQETKRPGNRRVSIKVETAGEMSSNGTLNNGPDEAGNNFANEAKGHTIPVEDVGIFNKNIIAEEPLELIFCSHSHISVEERNATGKADKGNSAEDIPFGNGAHGPEFKEPPYLCDNMVSRIDGNDSDNGDGSTSPHDESEETVVPSSKPRSVEHTETTASDREIEKYFEKSEILLKFYVDQLSYKNLLIRQSKDEWCCPLCDTLLSSEFCCRRHIVENHNILSGNKGSRAKHFGTPDSTDELTNEGSCRQTSSSRKCRYDEACNRVLKRFYKSRGIPPREADEAITEKDDGWHCPMCPKVLSSERYCKRHIVKYHSVDDRKVKLRVCRHCGKAYSHRKKLEYHIKIVHPSDRIPSDQRKMGQEGQMNDHRANREWIEPENLKYLRSASDKRYGQRSKQCKRILKAFVNSEKAAGKVPEFPLIRRKGKGWRCPICGSVFSFYENCVRHVVQCHGGEDFKEHLCDVCGKRFFARNFKNHMTTHTSERPFKCEHCDKTYRTKQGLDMHAVATHSREGRKKPHVCHICDKAYAKKYNLHQHVLAHSEERNFSCELCSSAFKNQRTLHRHKVHVHEKRDRKGPFKCDTCGRQFSTKRYLRYHNNFTHLNANRPIFKCRFCNRTFYTGSGRLQHEYSHTGRPHECSYCGKRFASSCNLTDHVRIHTGERPYKCDICGKGFTKASNLNTHKKGQHK